jgi:ribokinase
VTDLELAPPAQRQPPERRQSTEPVLASDGVPSCGASPSFVAIVVSLELVSTASTKRKHLIEDSMPHSAPTPAPFYLDCDTGIDDALALVYLLASPSVDLLGIGTVSGNISAETGARNTLDLLAMAGFDHIPVAVGASEPLAGSFDGGALSVHGDNGIGGLALPRSRRRPVAEDAPEMLVRLARLYPGELRVLAIGPLTNLARALELEPNLPQLVKELTIMGGAVRAPGNRTPFAEANIANDPEAAAAVFDANWSFALVPLDVTMSHLFDETHRAALLASPRSVHAALGQMLVTYFDYYETRLGHRASALHDPLAAAIATGDIVPDSAQRMGLSVDVSDGAERGRTIGVEVADDASEVAGGRVVLSVPDTAASDMLERILQVSAPPRTLTVVGSASIDLTCHVERLPKPGETVGGGTLTRQAGGKGGNQAAAAARLAGSSRMIGAVGNDQAGEDVLAALGRAGVDTTAMAVLDEPTGTAMIFVDEAGENQIAVAPGANSHLALDTLDPSSLDPVLCQLEIRMDTVLEAARRAGGFFALNAAPAVPLPEELVERCDLVIVNESEYALLPELASARCVAVTYGAEGAAIFERGMEVARVPAVRTHVVNSVGAGDAFSAALVISLTRGFDYATSLAAACAVGAFAVASADTQPAFGPLSEYLPG